MNTQTDLKSRAAARAFIDICKRSKGGAVIYLVLWVLVSVACDLYQQSASLVVGNSILLACSAVLRIWMNRLPEEFKCNNYQQLSVFFIILVLLNGLHWGLLTAYILYNDIFQLAQLPMQMITVGIVSAGTTVLAINKIIRFAFPCLVMFPPVLVLMSGFSLHGNLLAGIGVILLVYIITVTRTVYEDYHGAASSGILLEQRAQLLEELSTTDFLTGLRNRMFFDAQFDAEWKRAARQCKSMSIILIDLDYFKQVNDSYGHQFGDLCLQEVATSLLTKAGRAGDVVARYGGEEFIVLLPNTGNEGVAVVAERFLKGVRDIELMHHGERIPVTCSIGFTSTVPVTTEQASNLIKSADEALYRAKANGRDCYEVGEFSG